MTAGRRGDGARRWPSTPLQSRLRIPVVANVSATPADRPRHRSARVLVRQVTGTVRWRESVAYMAGRGVTRVRRDAAPASVLAGLVKRIAARRQRAKRRSTFRPTSKLSRAPPEAPGDLMFDLTGKTALVTGASAAGIGGAIARRAARAQARVARRCRAPGATRWSGFRRADSDERTSHVLPCDLSDPAAVDSAGAGGRGWRWRAARHSRQQRRRHARQSVHADEATPSGTQVIAVNLTTAAFQASRARACKRHDEAAGTGASSPITSIVGVTGNPGQGNYAAAKAGMIGMSKSARAWRSPAGGRHRRTASRRVSSPDPDDRGAERQAARARSSPAVPMGKLGRPARTSAPARWSISPAPRPLTLRGRRCM